MLYWILSELREGVEKPFQLSGGDPRRRPGMCFRATDWAVVPLASSHAFL